ncbi:hypothetical protein PIROE2DRAFT_14573 [Piromyces sp. E2]|nr:hypothetical protein PIROE2DRAFT_14573 [Piromyces sp. E2]|eukprot:OUM59805.1 hypothetical protein PIROE2DRAFT_14573 [Piromyces sp. E2]
MAKINQLLIYIYIIFILIFFLEINTKEIFIHHNDDNFNYLQKVINENQYDTELIVRFEDDYYDMSKLLYSTEITVNTNITLIGKSSGTTLDFKKDKKGRLSLNFLRTRGEKVQLINLNFINFYVSKDLVGVQVITVISKSNNFLFIVDNCNFQDNNHVVFHFKTYCNKLSPIDTQFFITNSYFSKIEKSNYGDIVFYTSDISSPLLIINNSIFEDINIKDKIPLIGCEGLTLENCHSDYGYLFNIYNQNFKKEYISIGDSTFQNTSTIIHGNYVKCNITNSRFKDMKIKNSIPAITDSKFSMFSIYNSEFYNLNISNILLGEESKYILENIKLDSIKTNSKSLLYFIYNNIELKNIEADNITCLGDSGDTSFILYDSGEIEKRLSIKNLHVRNSVTNGPLIKLIGKQNEFYIEHSEINDIYSYGSIIENLSKKV